MTSDRIKEIQQKTAYPGSVSVKGALLTVWNECEQENSKCAERIKIEYTIGILHELLEEIPVGSKESKIISNKFQQLQNQLK